ncbi:MAG: Na+/H+ antiporter, partial [Mycobacterium sp.]
TSEPIGVAERDDLARRVHLGVLDYKRPAVTELRDRNEIAGIVLRKLQSAMDLEEVQLLGPAYTD